MHDPIGFSSLRSFSHIKHESLFNANFFSLTTDYLIGSGSLPISGSSDPIRSRPVRVFSVSWTEKIPFFLSKHGLTRENPRVEFIEIDVADDLKGEIVAGDFPAEILN